MSKVKENIKILAAIVPAIAGFISIIGYINFDWVKNLFGKVLEYKIIIISIIVVIAVIIAIVKYRSYICKFFNWLLRKYFKLIWKIIGIEKWFKEENKNLPLEIDAELQTAINAAFADEQKKQTFISDYAREIKMFYEDDPDTLAILNKFLREKGMTKFIKYLEGFFEALSHWSEEKTYTWTILHKKRKEKEFLECMRHVDSGKLKELQVKYARLQNIIPEKIFFRKN
ncbi:MAG: hypothetical protein LBH25_00855 [Fibromonadaceae bacterium]|jgi:uncharacterized membrane protein YuzA (DUF378 family)|nr:hypothetical protein [Fibromonadaceae bacterium]